MTEDKRLTEAEMRARALARWEGEGGHRLSPLRRAVQTTKLVATATKLPICKSEGLNEIAFGELTGQHFDELIDNELYRRFIKLPATTLLPGGETISDVQRRGLKVIHQAAQKVPGGRFLFVSHGDVIRAILCHYMKLPLNEYRRLRVDKGSLSALQTDRRWAEIKYVNYLHEIILASKEPYMAAGAAALRK